MLGFVCYLISNVLTATEIGICYFEFFVHISFYHIPRKGKKIKHSLKLQSSLQDEEYKHVHLRLIILLQTFLKFYHLRNCFYYQIQTCILYFFGSKDDINKVNPTLLKNLVVFS